MAIDQSDALNLAAYMYATRWQSTCTPKDGNWPIRCPRILRHIFMPQDGNQHVNQHVKDGN